MEHLKCCELSHSAQVSQDNDDFGDFLEDEKHKIFAACTCGAADTATDTESQSITGKMFVLFFSLFIFIHFREVPRIIYATRTHKQISQVIRELRKTKYAGVK